VLPELQTSKNALTEFHQIPLTVSKCAHALAK